MKNVFIALCTAFFLLSCGGGKKDVDATATTQASERTETTGSKTPVTSNEGEVAQKAPVASHECVDLGLPSGTMWATCNVGATKPEEFGGKYAWGEIEEKECYSWDNYKFCSASNGKIVKYCVNSEDGRIDNKVVLEPTDDVAHMVWGDDWFMPTWKDFYELRMECVWQWTSLNGVNGYMVTGPNGNSIFLPATEGDDYNAYYWTSTLCSEFESDCSQRNYVSQYACLLNFNSVDNNDIYGIGGREYGYSVRPVVKPLVIEAVANKKHVEDDIVVVVEEIKPLVIERKVLPPPSQEKTTVDVKKSEKAIQEFEELMVLEKEETLNDLLDLLIKFEEEQKKVVSTDSLFHKLEQERIHAQALYEELQSTKATNAAEIKRLKKELKTLREVLVDYTRQIDELYQEDSELKEKNDNLKNQKKKVEKEKKEKKNLEEKVDIAAQLDATNISMVMLRSNGKETDNLKRATQIRISCTISRNVTASIGYKVAYVRIMQPNGEVLTNGYGDFKYQNCNMAYSICKEFEFDGEKLNLDFFWNIEETLQKGRYHVAIIVDGNMIGEGYADFE